MVYTESGVERRGRKVVPFLIDFSLRPIAGIWLDDDMEKRFGKLTTE